MATASRRWAAPTWTSSAAPARSELRAYARRLVEACFVDGHWAMGTGNSLTDYMPVESYLILLDEGMRATR